STTWGWSWTSPIASPCSTWARRSPRARPTRYARTRASSRRISVRARTPAPEAPVAESTLARLLQRNARDLRNRPAIREKDRGIWQTWTWGQYHDEVRDFALGLAALGFKRGERLSVIGDNRPRLYWAQVAAQCLGGVPVPVFQDSIAKELAFVWNHAECAVIVAEDQEQVDKVLALRDQLPNLRLVVYDDPRRMLHYKHEWLRSYQSIQELGREFGAKHPGAFEAEIEKGKPEDVAIIFYTDRKTGNPKGVMLTHANALALAEAFRKADDVGPGRQRARLPADGMGRRCRLHPVPEPRGRLLRQLSGEPGDGAARPARARTDDGAGAAAPLGEHADGRAGEGRRLACLEALDLRAVPRRRRAGRDSSRRRQAHSARAASGLHARRSAGLHADPRPARPAPGQVGAHRRRAARARHLSLLPVDRRQPQAGLRLHRDDGPGVAAAEQRGEPDDRRPAVPGHRGQDRRAGRGAGARARHLQGLSQERGGHARGHRLRGLVPHRRRGLRRSARSSGHHRSRQGRRRSPGRDAVRAAVHREQAEVQIGRAHV